MSSLQAFKTLQLLAVLAVGLLVVVEAQKHQFQVPLDGIEFGGERVDKQIGTSGDMNHVQPAALFDWFSLTNSRRPTAASEELVTLNQYQNIGGYDLSPLVKTVEIEAAPYYQSAARLDPDRSRNYRALVDNFKQWSHLANPSREIRAFKPKLMSTARGFGKRDGSSQPVEGQQRLSYADLLASANGKMSGSALR